MNPQQVKRLAAQASAGGRPGNRGRNDRAARRGAGAVVFLAAWCGVAPGSRSGLSRVDGAEPSSPQTPRSVPSFAIQRADGTFGQYSGGRGIDEWIDGKVVYLGDDQWELALTTKRMAVQKVWFPWEADPKPLNANRGDDVVYYPHLTGLARRADSLSESTWEGVVYPGPCFAPLIVIADDKNARIVAATNWPPRKVRPVYARHRLGLLYTEPVPPASDQSFRALIAKDQGDSAVGAHPWHRALDRYRVWLDERMRSAGLYPIPYPEWMKRIHGWQNVQLQNHKDGELDRVLQNWERFKHIFPWVQMWGQMSNFHRTPGERTGCCMVRFQPHPRYGQFLSTLVRAVASEGHVGFYARPRPPYGPIVGSDKGAKANRDFLLDWLHSNRTNLGANASYIDTLGGKYFGDPLGIARALLDVLPRNTVIERAQDIYPSAFLISGSLWGGFDCPTKPGDTPQHLNEERTCVTFPQLGRYLLGDRIMFLGESNGDHMFWGTARGHDHWTERQVFLLGAKFDAIRIGESKRRPHVLNRAVRLIVDERERVKWWDRDPVYLDCKGLSEIPEGVNVRRFRGKGGEDLLVVDNWKRRRGLVVRLDGKTVALRDDPIRVLVMER